MLTALVAVRAQWADGSYITIAPGDVTDAMEFAPLAQRGEVSYYGATQKPASSAQIVFSDSLDGGFEALSLFENQEYTFEIGLPLTRELAIEAFKQRGVATWPFLNSKLSSVIKILSPRSWTEDGRQTRIVAFFNPKEYLGSVDLAFWSDSREFSVEIESRKLNYRSEYAAILHQIAQFHIDLIHEIGSPSSTTLSWNVRSNASLLNSYFHLRRLMKPDGIPLAIAQILRSPISVLSIDRLIVPPHLAQKISPADVSRFQASLNFHPNGALSERFRGMSPSRLPIRSKRVTFDAPENSYVKSFLTELNSLLIDMESTAKRERKSAIARDVAEWREDVDEWLSHQIWNSVRVSRDASDNSQKLQRRVGYRDVLRADNELRQALELPLDTSTTESDDRVPGDPKAVHTLYEYWCYLIIRRALSRLYGADKLKAAPLIDKPNNRLSLTISKTQDRPDAYWSAIQAGTPVEIFLFFQRSFSNEPNDDWGAWSGSYSQEFDPDISIALRCRDITHWILFDAKYRSTTNSNNEDSENSTAPASFKKDDLSKMHTYRDAILGVRGAYILYPGPGTENGGRFFVRQPISDRTAHAFPGVGAISMRPMSETADEQFLEHFMSAAVVAIAQGSHYTEESGFLLPPQH